MFEYFHGRRKLHRLNALPFTLYPTMPKSVEIVELVSPRLIRWPLTPENRISATLPEGIVTIGEAPSTATVVAEDTSSAAYDVGTTTKSPVAVAVPPGVRTVIGPEDTPPGTLTVTEVADAAVTAARVRLIITVLLA